MDGVMRELQGRWPDHSAENTDRPTGTQRIADAVAARQRGGDQRQHLVPRVGPPPGAPPRSRRWSASSQRPKCLAKVAGRSRPALATRRWSSTTMRIRSGLSCGSVVYWLLLVSGRFSVSKPLSQIRRSALWLLQGLSPRPSFGG